MHSSTLRQLTTNLQRCNPRLSTECQRHYLKRNSSPSNPDPLSSPPAELRSKMKPLHPSALQISAACTIFSNPTPSKPNNLNPTFSAFNPLSLQLGLLSAFNPLSLQLKLLSIPTALNPFNPKPTIQPNQTKHYPSKQAQKPLKKNSGSGSAKLRRPKIIAVVAIGVCAARHHWPHSRRLELLPLGVATAWSRYRFELPMALVAAPGLVAEQEE